jgi:hypothetical protein
MPLTFGQGIPDQSELIDPFDSVTRMVQVAIEASVRAAPPLRRTDPESVSQDLSDPSTMACTSPGDGNKEASSMDQ